MDIQLKTGCFDDAALVRRVVFMDEQGYENEFDAIDEDPNCIHVTLYVDGELAGCSRVFPEELERVADAEAPVLPACDMDEGVAAGETYIMGRVAVLPAMRRRGLASAIVETSASCARDAGAKLIKLHAQEYVLPLYVKAGYTQIAPVDYEDEGQPHVWGQVMVDVTKAAKTKDTKVTQVHRQCRWRVVLGNHRDDECDDARVTR